MLLIKLEHGGWIEEVYRVLWNQRTPLKIKISLLDNYNSNHVLRGKMLGNQEITHTLNEFRRMLKWMSGKIRIDRTKNNYIYENFFFSWYNVSMGDVVKVDGSKKRIRPKTTWAKLEDLWFN